MPFMPVLEPGAPPRIWRFYSANAKCWVAALLDWRAQPLAHPITVQSHAEALHVQESDFRLLHSR
jgi:hypothetical protein